MSIVVYFAVFLFTSLSVHSFDSSPSQHLMSPATFFSNYQNMLDSFRIYIYTPPKPFSLTSKVESLFFSTLRESRFVTRDPEEAHLFFVPFSSGISTRSVARVVRDLRMDLPYWNRTLGADHFYLSCFGIGFNSDRNVLELKKNSVQISCFPARRGLFVPHKDVTLPPAARIDPRRVPAGGRREFLCFVMYGAVREATLGGESGCLIESEPSDEETLAGRLGSSEFCLFEYGEAGTSGMVDALRFGCVPVVVTDRPIQDMPLMDVLRWQEIALFVSGTNGVKRMLRRTCGDDNDHSCEGLRSLGVAASRHLLWNELEDPAQYDAFHMVMYQLWLRRHVIRYARRDRKSVV